MSGAALIVAHIVGGGLALVGLAFILAYLHEYLRYR